MVRAPYTRLVNDLGAVLAAAAACDAAGERWTLATVISVRGSTYRRPGARLLIPEHGGPVGLISGGCLEDEVARLGREALQRELPVLITIDHSAEGDEVWGSGLGCRGILELIAEPPELARETVAALRAARDAGTATYLLTGMDGTRRRLEVHQAAALGPGAAAAVRAGRATRIGAAVLDPIVPPPHLVICGAGPDAPALVEVATSLGWRVTVADPRRRLLATAAIDPAVRLDAEPAAVPDSLGAQPASAVVVMSHDYVRDAAFLGAFVGRGVAYLGVLGPRDRTERLIAELEASGTPLSEIDRAALHAPAGLDLGADGPQEVALAVAAEILAALRDAAGSPLRDRPGPIHPPM